MYIININNCKFFTIHCCTYIWYIYNQVYSKTVMKFFFLEILFINKLLRFEFQFRNFANLHYLVGMSYFNVIINMGYCCYRLFI